MEYRDAGLQRRDSQEEERRIEALVAARLEQRLQHELALQMDDVADMLLHGERTVSWMLESAAERGRHELLRALLRKTALPPAITARPRRSDVVTNGAAAVPLVKQLSPAWLVAAEKGHPECLRVMLEACKHCPTMLDELLDQGDSESEATALMMAVKADEPSRKKVERMRLLLEHSPGAQVVRADLDGRNALMHAALHGCTACMELLLAHSPEEQVAAVDYDGENALMLAASYGHAACMQLLLAHSPDAQMTQQCHGLHNALSAAARFTMEGNAAGGGAAADAAGMAGRECVELLVAAGARLPQGVDGAVSEIVWSIFQDSVRRARVPDMANAAVVGLALAAAGRGKRAVVGGEEGGAAAGGGGPPAPKAARTNA